MTPEGRVKKQVKELLVHLGAFWHMTVPTGWGKSKKTVDFFVCLRGRFVAIETKAPGEEPTALQRITLQEVHDAEGIAFYCDNVWSAVVELQKHFIFTVPYELSAKWRK